MSEFTPGPWSIFDQNDATRINVRGPSEEFVADCGDGFYSDETDDWVMAEESLPNARLIAAAPELLEALEKLIEAVRFDVSKERRLRIAEDVVAKAKGDAA